MTSKNAKELCAMLITRSLKDLTEDEEEIVVDYLEDLKIKTKLTMKPRELCTLLLEKAMEKDYGNKKVPLSAYANSLLVKEKDLTEQKEKFLKESNIKIARTKSRLNLEKMSDKLPGCLVNQQNIFSRNLYDILVDPELGIVELPDMTSQYTAMISLSKKLYETIFLTTETPIVEIRTNKGFKAYAKIATPHDNPDNVVYVSPLIAFILDISDKGGAFLQLCNSLPEIAHVKFTFYGNKEELNLILKDLIIKLPSVINAFSYLSLGMVLSTNINGKNVEVRVDSLTDKSDTPIFAGILPFEESDLPFDIEADL